MWAFADRVGLQPLNFDPAIVVLTATHFHYAGLVLPVLTGLLLERIPDSRLASTAAVGVVLGVPVVAIGITLTELGLGPVVETAAGCGLALAGMVIAVLHVRIATEKRGSTLARGLLGISGASLFFGMFLAVTYSLRASSLPVPRLDLATMRLLHGTVNALGFGLCGILGWRRLLLERSTGREEG
jgi:hypothetical protein